jgi:hypothetical protein
VPDFVYCSDCGHFAPPEVFLPKIPNGEWDPRLECPICYAPGYIIGARFQVIDSGGNLYNDGDCAISSPFDLR